MVQSAVAMVPLFRACFGRHKIGVYNLVIALCISRWWQVKFNQPSLLSVVTQFQNDVWPPTSWLMFAYEDAL